MLRSPTVELSRLGGASKAVLTVAAAEAAIGLAILVVLFRNRKSINVQELNTMKG